MATYADPTIVQLGDRSRFQAGPALLLVAGVISVLGAGMLFYLTKRTQDETATIVAHNTQLQTTLKGLQETANTLTGLDQTAKSLHTVFDNQTRWEFVLSTIQGRLYKNMGITAIQLDEKGGFSMTGYTPTYADYAKIYASMTDEVGQLYFKEVHPSTLTKAKGVVVNKIGVAPNDSIIFSFNTVLQPTVLSALTTLFPAQTAAGKWSLGSSATGGN